MNKPYKKEIEIMRRKLQNKMKVKQKKKLWLQKIKANMKKDIDSYGV